MTDSLHILFDKGFRFSGDVVIIIERKNNPADRVLPDKIFHFGPREFFLRKLPAEIEHGRPRAAPVIISEITGKKGVVGLFMFFEVTEDLAVVGFAPRRGLMIRVILGKKVTVVWEKEQKQAESYQ